MKRIRCARGLARAIVFSFSLIAAATGLATDLTGPINVTGGATNGHLSVTGNLGVTGFIDSDSNLISFGGSGTPVPIELQYTDPGSGNVFRLRVNFFPAAWLWEHKNSAGTANVAAMRLDSAHELKLYKDDGTTAGITLTPGTTSSSINFNGATLSGNSTSGLSTTFALTTGQLTANGSFTAASGITNTGTVAGGSTGLTLNAGASGQSVTLNAPSGDLIFQAGGSERARIKSTGNVGIGTSTPNYTLSFGSTLGKVLALYETAGGTNIYGFSAAGAGTGADPYRVRMFANGSEGMNLTAAGNVGIGTSSPTSRLTVDGGSAEIRSGNILMLRPSANDWDYRLQAVGYRFDIVSGGDLSNPRLSIAQSGNVGVGTTSPNEKLHVAGAVQVSGSSVGYSTASASGMVDYVAGTTRLLSFGPNSTNYGKISFYSAKANNAGGYTPMVIDATGYVGIGTLTPNASLDISKYYSANTDSLRFSYYDAPYDRWYWMGIQPYVVGAGNVGYRFRTNNHTTTVDALAITGDGNVGIGTTTPASALSVARNLTTASMAQIELLPAGGGSSSSSLVAKLRFRSTFDNYSGDQIPRVSAQLISGYNGGTWGQEYLAFQVGGSDDTNKDPAEKVRITASGNVGIGTTTPGSYKLAVNGTIRAKEVIVEASPWPDYVFEDDYALASLDEVEAHIKAKKHLPGIPSSEEIATGGVSLGEMQAKLLQKIEELTLHQIAQEKEIAALRREVATLRTTSNP